jgi:uncharacterized iron-regulated membrane protein
MKMVIVFTSNFMACSAVVGLVTWKKRAHAKHQLAVQSAAASPKTSPTRLSTEEVLAAAARAGMPPARQSKRGIGGFPQA